MPSAAQPHAASDCPTGQGGGGDISIVTEVGGRAWILRPSPEVLVGVSGYAVFTKSVLLQQSSFSLFLKETRMQTNPRII